MVSFVSATDKVTDKSATIKSEMSQTWTWLEGLRQTCFGRKHVSDERQTERKLSATRYM